MLCQPINPISAMAPHPSQMWPLGKKHKLSNTKVTTRKKKKSSGQSLTTALTSQTDVLANPPSPPSEGNILNFPVVLFYLDAEHIFNLLSRYSQRSIWRRRRRLSEHTPSHIINHSGIDPFSKYSNPFMILNLSSFPLWFYQVQHYWYFVTSRIKSASARIPL